jgi:hypothetical protein
MFTLGQTKILTLNAIGQKVTGPLTFFSSKITVSSLLKLTAVKRKAFFRHHPIKLFAA